MKKTIFFGISIVLLLWSSTSFSQNQKVVFAIHGGAGIIEKENISDELEKKYREKLNEAAAAGFEVLQAGGSGLSAVQAAIIILEDSPLFNAGRGSVFNYDGKIENDASVMNGKTLEAGAVAGIQNVKNPITAALAVLLHSPHVMLSGNGASNFFKQHDIEFIEPEWFYTERRFQSHIELKKQMNKKKSDGDGSDQKKKDNTTGHIPDTSNQYATKFGTVGAVALDLNGNLWAGTSTGGMTNKRYGRIGDSPVIGAGTYADNATCAVSCTGHGEYFIRLSVAHQIAAAMAYGKMPLAEAAHHIIHKKLEELGGKGGVIALDRNGNLAMPFNTPGMYRAFVTETGEITVMMYGEDDE